MAGRSEFVSVYMFLFMCVGVCVGVGVNLFRDQCTYESVYVLMYV